MGLTSALYTGLSGMNTNQFRIDVIGDNIANANTTGYKGSRSMFQTQFAQMFSLGTPPSANQGGSNGIEVGLGAMVGATQRNMLQGSTETTGLATDLAIDGNGFFVVSSPSTKQAYTRDGSFMLNADNYLVTSDGYYLQGFGTDADFNVIPGVLKDMHIPLGQMSEARATDRAKLSGNLSSDGLIASQGTRSTSQAMVQDAVGTVATGATALTSLRSAATPGTPLFTAGEVITVNGVSKGGRGLPPAQFVVGTTGTTAADLTNWLNGVLGIDTAATGGTPGCSISGGRLVINSNAGSANGLDFKSGDITSSNSGAMPFSLADSGVKAVGQSAYTSFTAYDSLGTPLTVNLTMVLDSKGTDLSTWSYIAESPDSVGSNRIVGTGKLTFDGQGTFTGATNSAIQINRANTGATNPLGINIDFGALSGLSSGTELPSLVVTEQTGFGKGTLNGFSVGADGTVIGTFDNGRSRTLGCVALATFSNPAGLTRMTNNVFSGGPNSGEAVIATPSTLGSGRVMSGALELSNVDLSREFIGLINASTGFSAAGKVITTSNQLLNDLMMLTR